MDTYRYIKFFFPIFSTLLANLQLHNSKGVKLVAAWSLPLLLQKWYGQKRYQLCWSLWPWPGSIGLRKKGMERKDLTQTRQERANQLQGCWATFPFDPSYCDPCMVWKMDWYFSCRRGRGLSMHSFICRNRKSLLSIIVPRSSWLASCMGVCLQHLSHSHSSLVNFKPAEASGSVDPWTFRVVFLLPVCLFHHSIAKIRTGWLSMSRCIWMGWRAIQRYFASITSWDRDNLTQNSSVNRWGGVSISW